MCTSEQECVSLAKSVHRPHVGDKGYIPQLQATPEELGVHFPTGSSLS